jgi:hypothetical protein
MFVADGQCPPLHLCCSKIAPLHFNLIRRADFIVFPQKDYFTLPQQDFTHSAGMDFTLR